MITWIFFLLMVTIAGYVVAQFGVSTSTAGLVSSIFIIGTLFGRLGGGRVIGEWGSKKTLFYGLLLFAILTMFYFMAVNLPLLKVNRLLQGAALGLASTATGTITAQILPPTREGDYQRADESDLILEGYIAFLDPPKETTAPAFCVR